MGSPPRFDRHALLACDACSEVFINWTRSGTTCRKCGATALHPVRWPTP